MSDKFHGGVVEGSVDVSIPVILRKTTDNTEQTGKIHSDVTGSYWRQGGVRTAITMATLGSVNAAHADGGFIEVDATNMPGAYRFDIPDAAFASGADWVVISAKVAGCYVFFHQYAIAKKTEDQVWNAARASHTTAGQFGEGVASVQGNVTGSVASVTGAVGSVTGNVGGNVAGSVGSVTGAVGSVTGNVGGNVTGSVASVTGAVGSVTGNVGGNVTGSVGSVATAGITAGSFAAGAINAAAIAVDAIGASELAADAVAEIAAAVSASTDPDITLPGTAQAGAATSITLPAGASAVNDLYKYQIVTLTGGTGAGQSRIVTAYNGTTKVATVDSAWATNPDATTTFVLRGMGSIAGATAPTAAAVADAVWDEALADHDTAGSTGAAVADVRANARNKKLATASTREVKVYKDDGTTVRYKRTTSNPDSDTTVATPS